MRIVLNLGMEMLHTIDLPDASNYDVCRESIFNAFESVLGIDHPIVRGRSFRDVFITIEMDRGYLRETSFGMETGLLIPVNYNTFVQYTLNNRSLCNFS